MSRTTTVDAQTQATIAAFCRRFEIRSLRVEKGLGITNSTVISDISMLMIKQQNQPELDYTVEFKLQRQGADTCQYLQAINTSPDFAVELTPQAEQLAPGQVNERLLAFMDIIRERVKSALKEQTVQNIQYVGNTFILNNATKFKVLSDEGDGRLTIEILTRDKPLDALLTASGLLDGLYLGSIKLLGD